LLAGGIVGFVFVSGTGVFSVFAGITSSVFAAGVSLLELEGFSSFLTVA
jgi:hypothetical protein